MSAVVVLPSRTRLRFFGAVLMACALGCGGRVDLGGSPVTPPPDAGPPDDRSAATLLRFDDPPRVCIGVGVDDTNLYFSTYDQDGPSVHRCRKTECAATLTHVARAPCASCNYGRIERVGDRIGFAAIPGVDIGGLAQIAACTPPACSDLRRTAGDFADMPSAAFAGSDVYFSISQDNTIYRCGFPSCPEGPRAFVRGSWSDQLATTREWVYWIDRALGGGMVKRKRIDETSAPEVLDLGAVLGPATDTGTGPTGTTVVHRIAAQDGWLYGLVASTTDPDIACTQPNTACVIARWPDDALGKPRELVYKSTVPISHGPSATDSLGISIRIVDSHLVFAVAQLEQGFSCDPVNCAATLRTHERFNADRIASDGEYLYWCATNAADGRGELRRSAQLQR
jgi:hypothetical protein